MTDQLANPVDVRERPEPLLGAVTPTSVDRGGAVSVWAVAGVVLVCVAAEVWIRWITSGDMFRPAPTFGPDAYPTWREVILRVEEALSIFEMAALVFFAVVLPIRRRGTLGIDAKLTIGCLVGSCTDGVLNMHQYLFAWNSHSVNVGSWASFMPLASDKGESRYAEGLLWGTPMYTYFCIGVAIVAGAYIRRLRVRRPDISNAAALARVWVYAAVFDFAVENLIIRSSNAYAFAKTPGAITLWAGSQYQFPVYETVSVATLGVLFTAVRLSATDSRDGVSVVERGFWRLPARVQGPARWFAVMGFAITTLFVVYHLPFNWFGVTGDSHAHLPSYMLPGR